MAIWKFDLLSMIDEPVYFYHIIVFLTVFTIDGVFFAWINY